MKPRELIRILRLLGAEERAARGSHVRFGVGACNTTVPNHKGEDIKTGTLHAIEKDLEPCLGKGWLKKAREGK
ncbi:MAG TPA: type II toxin-antitoxin system HicA family toxin [Anaeromyxobacteraceae bacterium]|nr:type II toxin-antitoxin system HicA family toxin [Anaeromyxobacteraceae bacterium]